MRLLALQHRKWDYRDRGRILHAGSSVKALVSRKWPVGCYMCGPATRRTQSLVLCLLCPKCTLAFNTSCAFLTILRVRNSNVFSHDYMYVWKQRDVTWQICVVSWDLANLCTWDVTHCPSLTVLHWTCTCTRVYRSHTCVPVFQTLETLLYCVLPSNLHASRDSGSRVAPLWCYTMCMTL